MAFEYGLEAMNRASRPFAIAVVQVLALCLVPTTGVYAAESPSANARLRVAPNPVAKGDVATAFGEGFCPPQRCSTVSIVLDGATVAAGAASKDGSVALRFRASVAAGRYTVTARQTAPNGRREATTTLVVRAPTTTTTTTASSSPRATPTTTTTSRTTKRTRRSTTSSTTGPTTFTTTAASFIAPPDDTATSSAPPSDEPLGAEVPDVGDAGFLTFLRWLLPGAVVMLVVIAVDAWRSRPTGSHDIRNLP